MPGSWSAPVETEGQLFEYWRVISANFGWIVLLTVAGGGLGFLVAALQPSMYQARTVLDIRSLNENLLSAKEGSAMSTTDSVLPESYLQTEIKILQSDMLRKQAIDRLPVPKPVAGGHAPAVPFWRSALGLLDPATIPRKQILDDASKRVKVRAMGNTRIVEILCAARDAQLAADVCNSVAQTYEQYNAQSRYDSTKETQEYLQSQLNEVKKKLTDAEEGLKDAARQSATIIDADGENLAQGKLRALAAQLTTAQQDRMTKQAEYDTAVSSAEQMASDSEPLREYRMRLTELKRQLAEVAETKTPEHFDYRQIESQIKVIESAIVREQSDLVKRLQVSYDSALRREAMIEKAYMDEEAKVQGSGDRGVQYMMLKRDAETERKLYDTLLQRVNEVGFATALRTSTINVVDKAVAPFGPYSPSQALNVVVGMFCGVSVGFAFSFLRLRADRTLHGPGEASVVLQLRELGVIPSVKSRTLKLLLARSKQLPTKTIAELVGDEAPKPNGHSSLVKYNPSSSIALATWLRNPPNLAEAFSGAMNSLLFATGNRFSTKVIVVTSPEPGDGKTTVATNLAISLAQIGRRVVVVDGDLRKPRLHDIFSKEVNSETGGLANILESTAPIDRDTLIDSVLETQVKNLWVLPTTSAFEGISTKLHSGRMRVLLERLRRDFEIIIIDSPPMLNVSDARVLGWLSDGMLLVLRARRTTRDAALAARECLMQDGIPVVGTILNDWNATKDSRYGAYGPSYAHRQ
jgi:capsular exopolysaccharide synthesis family protein